MFQRAKTLSVHPDSWPCEVGQLARAHGTTRVPGWGPSHDEPARDSIRKVVGPLGNTVVSCRTGDPA